MGSKYVRLAARHVEAIRYFIVKAERRMEHAETLHLSGMAEKDLRKVAEAYSILLHTLKWLSAGVQQHLDKALQHLSNLDREAVEKAVGERRKATSKLLGGGETGEYEGFTTADRLLES